MTAVMRRCWQAGAHDLVELWRLLTSASSDELRSVVEGTPAQPFLEPNNAKMFSNIRSVAGSALGALEYIQAQRAAAFLSFRIRRRRSPLYTVSLTPGCGSRFSRR